MKEFTEEYITRLKQLIEQHDNEELRKELADMHPADIAELYQSLPEEDGDYLYTLLDGDTAADALMELDEEDRRKLLSSMSAEDIAQP